MQVANPHLVARYQQVLQNTPRRVERTASGFEEGQHKPGTSARGGTGNLFRGEDRVTISKQAREIMQELAERDREVRAHEGAHAAAGGRHAGPPTYEMEKGPDGRSYAVGGEVSISTSPVAGDPEATLEKAAQIRAAAMAPAQPSAADRAIAAKAANMAARARAEISQEQAAEGNGVISAFSVDETEEPAGPRRRAAGSVLNVRA